MSHSCRMRSVSRRKVPQAPCIKNFNTRLALSLQLRLIRVLISHSCEIRMTLRKSIFWCHLLAGLMAGPVIAIMSMTGIAIAFEEEILRWLDRQASRLESVSGKGKVPLSIAELTRKIKSNNVGEKVSSIAMFSETGRAWEVHLGDDGPFYLDPFTGNTRASQAHGAHAIIHKLEEWHRWLGADDGQTSTGRIVTGV